MILRVKKSENEELSTKLIPFQVEAPNHSTLLDIIDSFKNDPNKEVFYNCSKVNRKKTKEGFTIESKWKAQVYLIDCELIKPLFIRQNSRSFEVSYKPLEEIVYKEKRQPKVKIIKEILVVSNPATNLYTSLV